MRFLLPLPVLAAFLCSLPLLAAAPASICLVVSEPTAGLEPASLEAAMRIEERKAGIGVQWSLASGPEACPIPEAGGRGVIVVVRARGEVFLAPSEGRDRLLDVSGLDPVDRAPEVARHVVSALGGTAGGPAPLVEPEMPPLPPPPVHPVRIQASPRLYAAAGGRWQIDPVDRLSFAFLELETGVTAWEERFAVAILGGWRPGRSLPTDVATARISAEELLGMVRGGIRFGRLVARAGVGAGGEWRTIVARGAAGLEPVSQRTVTGMIGAELEAFASVWRGLRAGGMLSTRFYLGGTSYTWLGRKVYRAPQATFGLGARIGFAF